MAKRLQPQAIVLDLTMPDMDGFQVFEALRSDSATQRIPVVLRTSRPIELIDRERLRGAIDIVSKHSETGALQLQRAIHWAGVVGVKPSSEVDYG
jgi:CheY-like chemotaxis protein